LQYWTFGPASHFFPCNVGPTEISRSFSYHIGPHSGCLTQNVPSFPNYLTSPLPFSLWLSDFRTLHYHLSIFFFIPDIRISTIILALTIAPKCSPHLTQKYLTNGGIRHWQFLLAEPRLSFWMPKWDLTPSLMPRMIWYMTPMILMQLQSSAKVPIPICSITNLSSSPTLFVTFPILLWWPARCRRSTRTSNALAKPALLPRRTASSHTVICGAMPVGALSLPVTMNTMFLTFLLELFSLASPRLTDDHSYYYNLHFFIYLFIYLFYCSLFI
jgi:hypothetical protein